MNTIKYLFILCSLFGSTLLVAQSANQKGIETTLNGFIEASNQKNWDKAFDYMYPKMFSQVPKQDLVDMMKSTEEDGMSIKVENARITSTSVPVTENDETFVRVDYESDMTISIKSGSIYDHPKSTYAMKEQFENNFGTPNVKWDDSTKEFKVHARKSMIAVNIGNNVWKMVEINMNQPSLMQSLFSEQVMDALVRAE